MRSTFTAAVTLFFGLLGVVGITGASAERNVNSTIIDGVHYDGYNVDHPDHPKIFRSISEDSVTDLNSPALQCGLGGPAPLSAHAKPGSEIRVFWTNWPGSHLGPVAVYLAECPGDCSTYTLGKEKVWFKIAETGKANAGTYYNVWPTYHITNGRPYTFTLPKTLHPGNYIVRIELISLHLARQYPGIQVYPTCFQISVSGSEKGYPSSDDLVSFPGAYGADSKGVVYNIYTTPVEEGYTVPGPRVAELKGK